MAEYENRTPNVRRKRSTSTSVSKTKAQAHAVPPSASKPSTKIKHSPKELIIWSAQGKKGSASAVKRFLTPVIKVCKVVEQLGYSLTSS